MPNPDSLLYQVSSQTSVPPPLAALLQQNPSFQTFLNENPQINQLLLSNPELVNQFQINPNLLKETQEHAKFLNTFLQENANLPQIIKDNPNVYGFILKQVDQAVKTGQDKTIVIQMTEADIKEAQKELQEAQQSIKAQSQSQNINSGLTSVNGSTTGTNAFTGFSREELLAILARYQAAQQSLLAVSQTLPAIGNENNIVYQTSWPKQQLNPNSALVTSWNSLSRPNGGSIGGQVTNSIKTSNDASLGTVTGMNGGSSGSTMNSENIDLNNLEDLIRIRALYIAMYNTEPRNIMDLQDFYNIVLAKLNVRTRKQIADFLGRFKISGVQSNGFQSSSFQSGSNGISGNNEYSTSNPGYANGYVSSIGTRPTWKDKKMSCKMRRFCRFNPSSPSCRQQ